MANPRLNTRQKTWLKNFLTKYPYYKKQRIWEGLSGDRFLLLEGTERLPLPLIPEFETASPGYRLHTLQVQLRIYGDPRKTSLHEVTTVYPHCNIGDKITGKQTEGQLSLSLSTALEIPEPINPVVVTWKPKRKARAKLGTQLSMPVTGLEAKLYALRQKARPHLPPISAQDLAQEKVATWSARDHKEVELPQVIVDLLLEKNADDDEWQSAIDLFGVIGLPGVLRYLEQLPSIRQHFNRVTSMASASAQVSPAALATITETQQVSLAPKVNQMKRIIALTLSISSLIFPPLAIAQTANTPATQVQPAQVDKRELIAVAASATQNKDYQLALKVANNVIGLFPDYGTGYLYRAIAQYRLGEECFLHC